MLFVYLLLYIPTDQSVRSFIKSLGIKTKYIPSADIVQLYNIFSCICLAYDLTVKGETGCYQMLRYHQIIKKLKRYNKHLILTRLDETMVMSLLFQTNTSSWIFAQKYLIQRAIHMQTFRSTRTRASQSLSLLLNVVVLSENQYIFQFYSLWSDQTGPGSNPQ